MRFARGLLVVASLIFVGIGLLYTISPGMLFAVFPEGAAGNADGRTEIRAVYGGIELGLGIFFGLGAARRAGLEPATLLAGLVSMGAGLARCVGFLAEGELAGLNHYWAILELLGGVAGFVAYRRLRAVAAPSP